MTTVLRSFLRSLIRRPALTLIQLAGVACGVAAVVGMNLASRSAMGSFTETVRFLQGQSTHSVTRAVGSLDETVLARIMADPDVRAFAPVLDRYLSLADGTRVRVLGLDPFLDHGVRSRLFAGLDRAGERQGGAGWPFILDREAVILESRLAEDLSLGVGQRFQAAGLTLRVTDTFVHPAAEPVVLMDLGHAQEHLGMRGRLDRIDLVLQNPERFTSRWTALGYRVAAGDQRRAVYTDMLRAFRLNLQALSLLALLVGVFLVYNTSMFSVVSRRREVGVLRSLGAGRSEIVAAVAAEVAVIGLAGGAVGGVLGFALAHFLTGVVGETVSRLYFFLRPIPPGWTLAIPFAGSALGFLSAILGGAYPLFQLARQDPVYALRGRVAESGQERYALWAAGAGLLAAAASGALLSSTGAIHAGYAGAFGLLLGLSFFTGALLIALDPLWQRGLRGLAGSVGSLAAGNVRRNLGRTSVAVAAFGVALSLSVGLGSMIGSFRHTLIWWMEGQISGDMYLMPPDGRQIPADLYRGLSSLPGVAGVDPYRNASLDYRGTLIKVSAVDPAVLGRFTRFSWLAGDDDAWQEVARGAVIVSESFHRRFGIDMGDSVILPGLEGGVPVTVAGIFYDYTTEHGLVMMSRDSLRAIFADEGIDSLAVFLDPAGPNRDEVKEEVRRRAAAAAVTVTDRRRFREGILSVFDATFAVTRSMRALAILVAFFGITGALLTLFLERRRDFGIYRAMGLSRREVAVMTLLEGVTMGLSGLVFSAVAGTALTLILIRVINLQSFNWTIFFHPEAGPYLRAAAIALTASAAAAVYPVARVLTTYPQIQLREE